MSGEAAPVIRVVEPGPLATLQDLGRPGWAHLGVGRSGAADLTAHGLANRLVGNAEHAATIELTFGGLRLRADTPLTFAVTGADSPVWVDGRAEALNAPLRLPAGRDLVVGAPMRGLRGYVAVRGGVSVEPVLGSRSTDLLSGLGPTILSAGDRLAVGTDAVGDPVVDQAPVAALADVPVLRVLPGPRRDRLNAGAWPALLATTWTTSPDSNRIAARLDGPALPRTDGELPSEPLVPGAVQVPISAQPLIFLADHPVTGGYPVLAVVVETDLSAAAQLRPGQRVRFRPA